MFASIRPPQHVDGVQVLPKFDMRGHHDPSAYERVPLPQETVPQLAPGLVPDRIRQGPEATWGIFGDSSQYMVYRSAASRVPLVDYLGGLGGTSIHASFDGSSVVFERNDARVTLDLAIVPGDALGNLALSWDGPSLTAWYGFRVRAKDGPPALEIFARSEDQRQLRRQATIVVRDHQLGRDYHIGGPGVALGPQVITFGNEKFLGSSAHVSSSIDIDLPFELPLAEDEYSFVFESDEVRFRHELRWRGDERFSTLDSTRLPRFSHLTITMSGFRESYVSENTLAGSARPEFPAPDGPTLDKHLRSYAVICAVVDKVFAAAKASELVRPLVSYSVTAFDADGKPHATSIVPHAGSVVYGVSPRPPARFSREQWDAYREAARIVKASPATPATGTDFAAEVFAIVHDFCFFGRQHPEVLGKLHEELVRDLLLLVFKTRFTTAEAEAFNYDGKTDFKVTNPRSKYEFVVGELKWWDRTDSAEKIFHQLVRKHATGQEAALISLMLCRNVDAISMGDAAREVFDEQPESSRAWEHCAPPGSHEYARRSAVTIGARSIPLYFAVAQLHHARM